VIALCGILLKELSGKKMLNRHLFDRTEILFRDCSPQNIIERTQRKEDAKQTSLRQN
jgi:hypothetical protein